MDTLMSPPNPNAKYRTLSGRPNGLQNKEGSEQMNTGLSSALVPSPPMNHGFHMEASPCPGPHFGQDTNITPSVFFKDVDQYSMSMVLSDNKGTRTSTFADPAADTPNHEKRFTDPSTAAILTVSASSKDVPGDRAAAMKNPSNDSACALQQLDSSPSLPDKDSRSHSNVTANDRRQGSSMEHSHGCTDMNVSSKGVLDNDISPSKTDELPRRVLTFGPSPDAKGKSPSTNTDTRSTSHTTAEYRAVTDDARSFAASTSNSTMRMGPLDGRHPHGQYLEQNRHSQPYTDPSDMGPPHPKRQFENRVLPGDNRKGDEDVNVDVDDRYQQQQQRSRHLNQHQYQEHDHSHRHERLQYNQHPNSQSRHGPKDFRSSPLLGHGGHYAGSDDLGFVHPFEPSPTLDRIHMPMMDIHSGLRSDSKNFEDYLLGSPAFNWSITRSAGKTVGGSGPRDSRTNRRVTYDLHDDPAFNEHHNSPITAPPVSRGSSSAARYYTPIITSGNDRQPLNLHSNETSHSYHSDRNYGPSPPENSHHDDYDHLRHYHRTFPTMRGHNPSPTRYDASYHHPPSNRQGPGASPMYATPVMPRGGPMQNGYGGGAGAGTTVPAMSSAHSVNPHGHHFGMPPVPPSHPAQRHVNHMGGFYGGHGHSFHNYPPQSLHPHSYMPRQDSLYPPHRMPYTVGISPYGESDPRYPTYPSPYQYPSQMVEASSKKKRKMHDGSKRPSRNPKRKKMYSDFVGVTYNKTHAKYQACITHYRKQHYLGRYKLACDAAKAYDQSARMLKGDAWKVNFQSEEEYQTARERELREVEEKKNLTDSEVENLRESSLSNFPSNATLREKLGLDKNGQEDGGHKPPQSSKAVASMQVPPPQASSSTMRHETTCATSALATATTTSNFSSTTAEITITSDKNKDPPIISSSAIHSNPAMNKSAVTPSPNVLNNVAKNSTVLMNEPLMSPAFKIGSSPSAQSLLGGTPFSMPGSSVKFNSMTKSQGENNPRDFGCASSNIFQSPYMKDLPISQSGSSFSNGRNEPLTEMEQEDDSDEKGKGDLTAASALLMMNGN